MCGQGAQRQTSRLLDARDDPTPSHREPCPYLTKFLASFCQMSLPSNGTLRGARWPHSSGLQVSGVYPGAELEAPPPQLRKSGTLTDMTLAREYLLSKLIV